MTDTIHDILKKYWGFNQFRPLQENIIRSVLNGTDTLALLPTGGGKSLCYQVPALMQEGICLVVSPLVALMKDQAENLQKKNIPCGVLFSGMQYRKLEQTLRDAVNNKIKFLFVSPERLQSKLLLSYLPGIRFNLVAIDEAHCISQWGYDFRPAYRHIAIIREEIQQVPFLALTASATPEVRSDICAELKMKTPAVFCGSFARPNLSYSVFNTHSKPNKLLDILQKVKGSKLVYCNSRRKAKEIAELLGMHGFNADYYHAGLTMEERHQRQERWLHHTTEIMVCTNAFGMGIDKPDVRCVVHFDTPDCLESYYQEAGRAGRDGQKAYAVLLYHSEDLAALRKLPNTRFPKEETIRKVYSALVNYLQVPSQYGEQHSYDFDLRSFSDRFKLTIQEAVYSLKILETEGLIQLNEQVYTPPTVGFTSNRERLTEMESAHSELDYLIKGLLRTYAGIFDNEVFISEKQLSSLLKTDKEKIVADLHQLNRLGIVQYKKAGDSPQIRFLDNRVAVQDLQLHKKEIAKRKASFTQRLEGMIDYLNNSHTCRTQLICSYFNDPVSPCGICDACYSNKKQSLYNKEFTDIKEKLLEWIDEGNMSPQKLYDRFPGTSKMKMKKVLDYLLDESIVVLDSYKGVLKKKKG